jgi:hypothetical protein
MPDGGISIAPERPRARDEFRDQKTSAQKKSAAGCGAFLLAFSVVPEQREQQNDRQRDSKQPKQSASSKTHGSLLHFIVQMTQEARRSSAMEKRR